MIHRKAAAALVLLAMAGCSRDPEVAKREHMDRGDQFAAQGKWPEAVIEYRNAVRLDDRFGQARGKLAEAYLETGDVPNAYREVVRAADLLPKDAQAQIRAARLLLWARRFEEAQARAEAALALGTEHVEAIIIKANALAGLNKIDDAVSEIEAVIRDDPSQIAGYTNLGTMQFAQGNRQKAEATFRRAVEVAPRSVDAHLALANYLWAVGRAAEAEQEFRATLAIDPKNRLANRALTVFYLAARRPKEAEPFIKTLSEVWPNDSVRLMLADYYLAMGRGPEAESIVTELAAADTTAGASAKIRLSGLKFTAGQRDEAKRLVSEVLRRHPNHIDALLAKIDMDAREGNRDAALQGAEEAVRARPESAAAHFALGRVRAARQERTEAIAAFAAALKINPRMTRAHIELARLHLATGRIDLAQESAQDALRILPGLVNGYVLLARTYLMQGAVEKAQPIVRGLAKVLPESPIVQGEVGQLELLLKNERAARQAFSAALAKNPVQTDALVGLVALELKERKPDAAKALLAKAVQAAPNDAGLLVTAGRAYAQMGDLAAAERCGKSAIEADPNTFDGYALLGGLYLSQRRLDEAATQFAAAGQKQARPVGAYTAVGILLQMQNRHDEARAQYERVLAFEPRAAVAANNLALIYLDKGESLDSALKLAQTAKAGLPERPEINDTLGWIYVKKGLGSLAVPPLLEAIEKAPRKAVYHYHLAMAYASINEKQKARLALQKALSLDANFNGANDARRTLAELGG
jgi:tetratricopeptide (TPR) repeat protein